MYESHWLGTSGNVGGILHIVSRWSIESIRSDLWLFQDCPFSKYGLVIIWINYENDFTANPKRLLEKMAWMEGRVLRLLEMSHFLHFILLVRHIFRLPLLFPSMSICVLQCSYVLLQLTFTRFLGLQGTWRAITGVVWQKYPVTHLSIPSPSRESCLRTSLTKSSRYHSTMHSWHISFLREHLKMTLELIGFHCKNLNGCLQGYQRGWRTWIQELSVVRWEKCNELVITKN